MLKACSSLHLSIQQTVPFFPELPKLPLVRHYKHAAASVKVDKNHLSHYLETTYCNRVQKMTFRSFYAACPLSLLNRYKATLYFVFFGIGSSFRVPENLPDSHRHDAPKTGTSVPHRSLHLTRSIRPIVEQEVLKHEVGHSRHRPDAVRNQQRRPGISVCETNVAVRRRAAS